LTPKQRKFLESLVQIGVKVDTYDLQGDIFKAELKLPQLATKLPIEMNRKTEEFYYMTRTKEGNQTVRIKDTTDVFFARISNWKNKYKSQ